MIAKSDLIRAIRTLLKTQTVGTQEEICLALGKQGLVVNQVRVSRLLHELGAIKQPMGDRVVYALPPDPIPVMGTDPFRLVVLDVAHNGALIVVLTTPGSAQLVAHFLDGRREALGILGIVAGDDTLFVAPKDLGDIQSVCDRIRGGLI